MTCEAGRTVDEIDVGDIVAAALSHDTPLSADELAAFDQLLEEDTSLTEEQRREFLQALWSVIVSIIDFAWKDHPIQHALQECGKLTEIDSESAIEGNDMIQSRDKNLTKKYTKAAEWRQ